MADPRADLAQTQSAEQERESEAAEAYMLAAWRDAYAAAAAALAVLLARVDTARADGVRIDRRWLRTVGRLQDVMATTRRALRTYATTAAATTTARQVLALNTATRYATDLVAAAVPDGVTLDLRTPDQRNLDALAGRMSDGSPLPGHLRATIADDAADAVERRIAQSLLTGANPQTVAKGLAEDLALAHTRAVTIMRTETLGVLREATRQTYAANPDVVASWTWLSALDRRTCPACAIMHGTRHPVTETLDGHPRCRCAMVPDTVSYASLGITGVDDPPPVPLGVDWIMAMAPATRRAYLGPGKYAALESGEIRLEDLVARRDDPRWGTMRAERSLRSIREGRNANFGGLQPVA